MWEAHKNQYCALISEKTSFTANCKMDPAALVLLKWHIKLISAMFWGHREHSGVNDVKPGYTIKGKLITNCTLLCGYFCQNIVGVTL